MTLLCKVYRSPRRAETYLYVEAAQDTRAVPPELLRRKVAEGKLGKKSGEGFYRWDG